MYVIEAQSTKPEGKNNWFGASFDHFGTPVGFKASDKCWQLTGIHATFNKKQGMRALELMSEQYPEFAWRLMKLKIAQQHSPIAEIAASAPGQRDPDWDTDEHKKRTRAVSA